MNDNRRLTRLPGEPAQHDNIVDADFVEIDPDEPTSTRRSDGHKPIRPSKESGRKPSYLKGCAILLVGLLAAIILIGSVTTPSINQSGMSDEQASASVSSDIAPPSSTTDAPLESNTVVPRGLVTEGNCHMGVCIWSNILGIFVVKKDQDAELMQATVIGGSSPDTGIKSSDRKQISWDGDSHQIYIFCSHDLPAVMVKDGDRWQVDILDFVQGIPDILNGSANIYSYACHGKLSLWSKAGFAERYGYKSPIYNEVTVEKPEDIFSQ